MSCLRRVAEVIAALRRALAEITGWIRDALQPAATHSEFTGVLMKFGRYSNRAAIPS